MLRRIHVHYTLASEADEAVVERVHGFHVQRCPVARSIGSSVDITTSYELA